MKDIIEIIVFAIACFLCGWGAGRAHYKANLTKAYNRINEIEEHYRYIENELNTLHKEYLEMLRDIKESNEDETQE